MLFVGLPGKNIGKKPEKGKSMQSPHPRTGKLQYFCWIYTVFTVCIKLLVLIKLLRVNTQG